MCERLITELDSADLFLRNRANAMPAPLNEYDKQMMLNIAKTADEAARVLERAVVPPCKVGDVVWLIGNMKLYTKEECCSRKVTSVQMLRTGELIMHFKDGCFPAEAVGVYVFSTREEAEAKMKEGGES